MNAQKANDILDDFAVWVSNISKVVVSLYAVYFESPESAEMSFEEWMQLYDDHDDD